MNSTYRQHLNDLLAANGKGDLSPHLFIAYSGGLDSTVLLHLSVLYAREHDINITAVHVNHGLSANADDWQQHCVVTCQNLGVELITKQVSVKRGGQGLEAQAREVRYKALEQVIKLKKPQRAFLLTGQHRDDQVETFFLQLKRGSGIKGLAAMAKSSLFAPQTLEQSYIIRPLLNISREQLHQYAVAENLSWVEDESNQDTRFDRNFLRQTLLPQLSHRWSGFDQAVCRSIKHLSEQQQLIEQISAEDFAQVRQPNGSLAVEQLLALSLIRRNNLLRYWFEQNHVQMPSAVLMQRINDEVLQAKADARPQVSWQQVVLRRFKQRLYLTQQGADCQGQDCCWALSTAPSTGSLIELTDVNGGRLGQLTAILDQQGQLPAPSKSQQVTVRFAPKGQFTKIKCRRLGHHMQHSLGDLFKQFAVPPWLRSRIPLIYYDQQLVAVGDLFVCHQGAEQHTDAEHPPRLVLKFNQFS